MVVLILESVPSSLRGELSRWMLEPKAGVFVGTLSAAVRDLIWEKAVREVRQGGCTMLYRTNNEQGFAVRSFGDTTREVEEWEGLFLVRRPTPTAPGGVPVPEGTSAEPTELHPELWAKSPRGLNLPPEAPQFHPLLCHLIDAAMVALQMWRRVLSPSLKARLTQVLRCSTQDEAGRWVAFFAGLHDLGKATPNFACQWEEGWFRIRRAGYEGCKYDKAPRHGDMTAATLFRILGALGCPEGIAIPVAQIIGGHHGLFPQAIPEASRKAGGGRWDVARSNLVRALLTALDLKGTPWPTGGVSGENGFLVTLAGLTSVADWIASDISSFPFAGDTFTVSDYCRRARRQARQALHRLGWLGRPSAHTPRGFTELFSRTPNALQRQVIAQLPDITPPGIFVIESPMGGGKTEAALTVADAWAGAGHPGFYIALPTMATSNQIFGRVQKYLGNRYPGQGVTYQLLHGHASLHEEFELLLSQGKAFLTPSGVGRPDEVASGVMAAEWFTYKKRGLLAPYGVGTVDQALMAVLQTKHFFVRLFGLAGRVVILDEVHAYDAYMMALMAHLLTWLGALGSPVVLVSATLPERTRASLLSAYAAGMGRTDGTLPTVAYPRLSWWSGEGPGAISLTGLPERTIYLNWFEDSGDLQATPWTRDLVDRLAGGGCAAVICNNVRRAQAVFCQLRKLLPAGTSLLFHAQFPFDDRMEREKAALRFFGPDKSERPERFVLVATQVVEQSLDLDFDLIVTDLAPVDLLLQRSGRLFRHDHTQRPALFEKPTLWVIKPPQGEDGGPAFSLADRLVYAEHVLLASWHHLKDRKQIAIPGDVSTLVETVYGTGTPPDGLDPGLTARWVETAERLAEVRQRNEKEALTREIPSVTAELLTHPQADLDDDEQSMAHPALRGVTRLSGPSCAVVCLVIGPDGSPCLPDGTAVDLEAEPDLPRTRALLGRSLRISRPDVAKVLLAAAPPPGWRRSAHVRAHRCLIFDQTGRTMVGQHLLTLDPDLGLVYGGEEADS